MARTPRWAMKLSAKEYRHLQEGQAERVPTLRNLVLDAATCPDCKRILEKIKPGSSND
jgi:hypothetical protein